MIKKIFKSLLYGAVILTLLPVQTATAQNGTGEPTVGIPWQGGGGINESVSQITKREELSDKLPFAIRPRKEEYHLPKKTQQNPLAPQVSQWPLASKPGPLPEVSGMQSSQTVGASFLAVQLSEASGYIPPDCNGDVGPSQILMHVNGRIRVFNKDGSLGPLNVSDNTFWSSVRNNSDVTDPHVRYDRLSGRWFAVIINMPSSGANRVLIAVSSGSVISGSSSFTFFQFQHDQVGTTPNMDTGAFADYPTLGIDANALYIGANIFNSVTSAFIGTSAYVVRKSNLLSGSLTVTAFRGLTNGSTAGPFTPQGVHNDDPSAAEGYFIGVDAVSFSELMIRRVTNPGGTPVLSGNISLTVPTTTYPIPQVVLGSASNRRLDGLDDRLYAAQMKKNRITGETTLWTAHNIEVNAGGVGAAGGGRNGSRWYEISNLTSTPTLRQSGTLYSSASSAPRGYWIPSVAGNGQGHMALGASYASLNDYAGVVVSGRYSPDPLGTTQAPVLAQVSSTPYNVEANDNQRWGDYSQVGVDPNDDMTFWTFQEYCNSSNSWGMRVMQLIAPGPATPATASPSNAFTGSSNIQITLSGTSVSGSGFFDPGSGYPNRIGAAVNGGGITVNSVAFNSATSVTLNVSVDPAAAQGPRTITVTNPDGQSATSSTGILTIINSSCPSIALTPSALPGATLAVPYSETISSAGGAAPYAYLVTGGGLPGGITLSGDGVLSGTPGVSGVYPFTITSTDQDGCSGSQSYSISVGGCPVITVSPAALPNGTAGSLYNQTISAGGGTSPYSYAVGSGALPAGLSLSTDGILSGTPVSSGSSGFTVTSTDAALCAGNQAYSLTINPAPGNSVSLSSLGTPYTQDFNTLAASGSSSSMPSGWMFSETGANQNTTYTAGIGSGSAGDTYSFGATSSSDRAMGGLLSSSLVPVYGASFTNNTGGTISSLAVSYTGEEWRLGATGRADTIQFQLSTNATGLTAGVYTRYSTLDFPTQVTAGTLGAIDGNAAINRKFISDTIDGLNLPDGSAFFIKWTDKDVAGADDGLAVDDFSIIPLGSEPPCPAIVISPSTLMDGTIDSVYHQVVSASGGEAPYSYSVTIGALPDGLSLNADGSVSGIPSVTGLFQFTIGVVDANECAGSGSFSVNISETGDRIDVAVADRWNLVSNPLLTPSDSVSAIFPGSLGTAYGYSPGGYLSSDRLYQGFGYWLRFPSPDTVSIAGIKFLVDTVEVQGGWNLIGSLSGTIGTGSVAGIGTAIQTFFFGYNDGYVIADSLRPGEGYWVKVDQPGQLLLGIPAGPLSAPAVNFQAAAAVNLLNEIIFEDDRGRKRSVYYGSKPELRVSDYELPPPPPEGFDVRFSSQRCAELYQLPQARPLEFTIVVKGSGPQVTLRWDSHARTGEAVKLQIREENKKEKTFSLEEDGETKIFRAEGAIIRLIVYNENEIPRDFILHDNNPNPFNPVTSIGYELPAECRVKLSVYNILGELVAKLVEGVNGEGYHSVDWNANEVASGVYFYKIEAAGVIDQTKSFVQIKKMVVSK